MELFNSSIITVRKSLTVMGFAECPSVVGCYQKKNRKEEDREEVTNSEREEGKRRRKRPSMKTSLSRFGVCTRSSARGTKCSLSMPRQCQMRACGRRLRRYGRVDRYGRSCGLDQQAHCGIPCRLVSPLRLRRSVAGELPFFGAVGDALSIELRQAVLSVPDQYNSQRPRKPDGNRLLYNPNPSDVFYGQDVQVVRRKSKAPIAGGRC